MYNDIDDLIIPQNLQMSEEEHASVEHLLKIANKDTCQPCSFTSFTFTLKKLAKSCQVCQYELKKPKWMDIVLCPTHGAQLCLGVSLLCIMVSLQWVKIDGSEVTDYSWTCREIASCWDKFHKFYAEHGLFTQRISTWIKRKSSSVLCSTLATYNKRNMQN